MKNISYNLKNFKQYRTLIIIWSGISGWSILPLTILITAIATSDSFRTFLWLEIIVLFLGVAVAIYGLILGILISFLSRLLVKLKANTVIHLFFTTLLAFSLGSLIFLPITNGLNYLVDYYHVLGTGILFSITNIIVFLKSTKMSDNNMNNETNNVSN